MRVRYYHVISVLILITAGHFLALRIGLYHGKVWIDMLLHFIAGIFFGISWLWLLQSFFLRRLFNKVSRSLEALSMAGFALFASFSWEVFEYLLNHFYPQLTTRLRIFSPDVSDVLSDMFFGLLGGVAFAVPFLLLSIRREKSDLSN